MTGTEAAEIIRAERKFLRNILKDFKPEHGDFRPTPEMMSVTQQVRHIAQTLKWFKEGAFGGGFTLDFERMHQELSQPGDLPAALADLEASYQAAIDFYQGLSSSELDAPLADNPFFGNAPRHIVIAANSDHTAHHRGALTVYQRLLGLTPVMVYSEA